MPVSATRRPVSGPWTKRPNSAGRAALGRAALGVLAHPAVMVADAGRAWLELGCPKRAEPYLTRGIDMLQGSQPRNLLLHSASLAEARLTRGELDGAAAAATDALALAEHVSSQRAHARLMALRRRFVRYDSAVARDIVQRADALLAAGRARAAC